MKAYEFTVKKNSDGIILLKLSLLLDMMKQIQFMIRLGNEKL